MCLKFTHRVRDLLQALKRIEGSDFNYCVTCEDEIAPKRSAIDPAISIYIRCAYGAAR